MNGMIAWFARNSVAANLLMLLIIVSGGIGVFSLRVESFPEFSLDMVEVQVRYLGAAPEEVEDAVCIPIEEAIQGLEGIKQITSTASEGLGSVMVEVEMGADTRKVLDDIKSSVDAIDTFPEQTEKPVIRQMVSRNHVIDVAISGSNDELTLKRIAERVRDDLSAMPQISQIELVSARPYEISIEVSEASLRRHNLTFDDVTRAVRQSSLDLPGGSVKSDSGEILLRTIGQAYRSEEFASLVLLTRSDGTRLRVGDVATVVDGFAETDQFARFDAQPSVMVSVFRSGEQSSTTLAELVIAYVERARTTVPDGIALTVWRNEAQIIGNRLSLMGRNGVVGFSLVFLMLSLFLGLRLALWISVGIPLSFLGSLMLMPSLGVTINEVSSFAFILVLGIVVDDAIIVGENIFRHQERHGEGLRGSIEGAQEISTPVVFAVLTTVAAFTPLMFVPGMMGNFLVVIPLVVIPCLLFSLLESLNVLPVHLSHIPKRGRPGPWRRFKSVFANGLSGFVHRVYRPSLDVCLRWRYLTAAVGVSTLIVTLGVVFAGRVTFIFFPTVDGDSITASLAMPQGTPVSVTSEAVRTLEVGAERLRREVIETTGTDIFRHAYAAVGDQPSASSGPGPGSGNVAASNVGEVTIELLPANERLFSSEQLGTRWRELTGPIPEAMSVSFEFTRMGAGRDVDVMLVGPDIEELSAAASEIKTRLRGYEGVYDIADSFQAGNQEIQLDITPRAEALGLSLEDLGRQVRQAFYGEEAQRIQRGRDDIRVMVRYPAEHRRSLGNLEEMWIRTPDGVGVPFRQVADVQPGHGFASIKRVDRNRSVNVTASIDPGITSSGDVVGDLVNVVLPEVLARYPGVVYIFQGIQAEQQDAIGGLQVGFGVALLAIFALLAIPLKSYIQPLIIMSAIPFGLVGAIWGHIALGLEITLFSVLGLVALTGVVVNDSLVMVDFINRKSRLHPDLATAVREAGMTRFRPILLTSVTTFVGLAPLMIDRSFEAAFLVPMAVSLSFGVVFATCITLVLVPTWYLILEDVRRGAQRIFGSSEPDPSGPVGAIEESGSGLG